MKYNVVATAAKTQGLGIDVWLTIVYCSIWHYRVGCICQADPPEEQSGDSRVPTKCNC
jgi:hypothetical protein